jgi:Gram-negative bacterial TonB protein C-terminal
MAKTLPALFAVAIPLAALQLVLALHAAPGTRHTIQAAEIADSMQSRPISRQAGFKPAGVISASDVQYPIQTTAEGIVIFNLSLDERGKITGKSVLTGVPPLTGVARESLRSWEFSPAGWNGAHQASHMLVAFVFRHAVKMWNPPPFTAVFAPKEQSGYIPPGIFSVAYSEYPASTIAAGATVLQVSVKPDNTIGTVKVVRPMSGGFLDLAVQAARQWQFQAAVLDGSPVASNVAIAFVFSSRALNRF